MGLGAICGVHSGGKPVFMTEAAAAPSGGLVGLVVVVVHPRDGQCQGTPAAYPPVTGQGRLNGCGSAKAG
jgi:hypothetical protein